MRHVAGIILLASITLSPSVTAQTVLTTSAWGPPNHPAFSSVTAWGEELEERSEGQLVLRTLPTAPVGAGQTLDAVRDGLQDIGIIVHAYNPGRFVLTGAAELPFLGSSAETMSVAYQRIHERHLETANEHRGVVPLAVFTHGPGQILNTQHPVNSIEDLAGLRWRVGGGVASQAAELLGATYFLRPAPESYELLNSGIADGIFFPVEGVVSYRLDELIRYVTLIPGGFYNISWALIMNESRYSRLSPEEREVLMDVAGENFARMVGKAWDSGDTKGLELLTEAGAQIDDASESFVDSIKTALAPIEASWIEAAEERGVDGTKVLADLRAELEALELETPSN